MSALTLLLACVVDLPAFVGSSESTTMATGDTSQPSETTGPTGGSSDTASTGTMGPTGSSMPPTGDTGRAVPSCTFEAAATGPGILAPAAALDSFDLHSYAIAMAGGGPKGQDALWYRSAAGEMTRRHLAAGAPTVDAFGEVGRIRQLRAFGDHLLILTEDRRLRLWDRLGVEQGFVSIPSSLCQLPDATGGIDMVLTDGFNLTTPGAHILAACADSSPESRLLSWSVDALGNATGQVSWSTWYRLGWVGYDHRSVVPVDLSSGVHLWAGTRPYGPSNPGDRHQLALVGPTVEGTSLEDATDHILTIEAASDYNPLNATVQPRLADLDGNGQEDLLATFPGDHDGDGSIETELWVLLNIDTVAQARRGEVLTRDDMDVIVTAGGAIDDLGDAFDVLPHADGHVSVAISATQQATPVLAVIESMPLSPAEVALEAIVTFVLEQPNSGLAPFLFDVQDAGDLDGDGCRELLVHTMEWPYPNPWGQGTAYVYAGD